MQGEKNSRKNKWRNKCRKNIIGLKKVKSKIINKRGGIITEAQKERVITDSYEQLYTNKLDNLD